jgi:hypothetical protein
MERVLKVSYGYLKFTFSAMLASTILFSLTGLAIKSPRVCLVFIILGIAAFFIGKDELQTRRKHADALRRHVEGVAAIEKLVREDRAVSRDESLKS